MRRVMQLVGTTVAGAILITTLPAGGAAAAPTVPDPLFGQHVAGVSAGVPTTLPSVGAIRLWDSGVTWKQIEVADNNYNWAPLDKAVANARKAGAREVLYTLGSTPKWAATPASLTSANVKLALYGAGSNSHPRSNKLYLDYLAAVAARYKGKITAYQVWNEANLRDFYLGTPTQMATLTKEARQRLKQVDPNAKLVAASTTVRAKGPVGKFGKAYGKAMRKAGWPVDAVSAHFYPPAKEGPATRVKYIRTIKKYYKRYGARSKPLWDTEMSYGDTRKYMPVKRTYTGPTAATYVARTYIDSMRYGVSRVFWYGWDQHVLGTDMTSRQNGALTAGGKAFLETRSWMSGRTWLGCKVKSKVTTCTLRAPNGVKQTIRYASKARSFKVPAGATQMRRLDGSVLRVVPGSTMQLTTQPVLFVGG